MEAERAEAAAGREREQVSGPEVGQEGVVPQFDSGRGGRDGSAVRVGEDGRQAVVTALRQLLRPGSQKLLDLDEKPGLPLTEALTDSGAVDGRQMEGSGPPAERPPQCGTEADAAQGHERIGPQPASGASKLCFGSERVGRGSGLVLMRPVFGSGSGVETPEADSGSAETGSGRSEFQLG